MTAAAGRRTILAMEPGLDLAESIWLEMEVKGLLLDPASETPVLLLQAVGGTVVLPIWIGQVEANSIATALEGIREPRPMTHDLLHGVLQELGVELNRVEIWALREGTFYGRLQLRRSSDEVQVDARPSDAIALAVRVSAPIYVAEEVMEQAGMLPEEEMNLTEEGAQTEVGGESSAEDLGAFKDFVEGLDLDSLLGN